MLLLGPRQFVLMLPLLPQKSIHFMTVLKIKAWIMFFPTISRTVLQALRYTFVSLDSGFLNKLGYNGELKHSCEQKGAVRMTP